MFVKICGVTNEEDALLAVALGADCIGFNFVAGSIRRITPAEAEAIARRLPHGTVTVGVFKNESPDTIVSIVTQAGLSGAQLHGREPVSEVRWIRKRLPFVVQAFSAEDPHLASAGNSPADIILVDSATPGAGHVFDWRLASNAPSGVRLMIAGGLNPDNITEAITQLRPYGVDVATGVESTPGKKDAKKMQKFIALAKASGYPKDNSGRGEEGGDSDARSHPETQRTFSDDHQHSSYADSTVSHSAIYDWMDDGQ